ncbi:jg5047 [Pararge aegeria aegeria]|uniref:Jg5047 protein n=1 Tax=Pararge aegeria aegeria TaxID=348720 RepID=A0A8S4SFN8_9NEOP|nr:jg5047 [Pararge aegeria aegeria]
MRYTEQSLTSRGAGCDCASGTRYSPVARKYCASSVHFLTAATPFDVRGKHLSEARHWSAPEVFGPRAHFSTSPPPASLLVRDVKRRDEGVYRCRVDFRNTQTTSFRYNLTVVVPPEKPVVVDRWGRVINATTLGPHEEGDDVLLTCRVLGGRPEPSVRWLVNGVLVDEEYEHNTGDVIENRLLWPAIRRADYAAVFTCQAANSHLVPPKEVSLVLDMFLRPLTVEIKKPTETGEGGVLTAERRYEVACESAGSRPPAAVTWHKGKRQLKRITITVSSTNYGGQSPERFSEDINVHKVRPLTVEIKKPTETGEGGVLTAERRYEVACESAGSRPPAAVTWHKGKRQLKRITLAKFVLLGCLKPLTLPLGLSEPSSLEARVRHNNYAVSGYARRTGANYARSLNTAPHRPHQQLLTSDHYDDEHAADKINGAAFVGAVA